MPVLQREVTREVNTVRPPEFSRSERTRVLVAAAVGSVVVGYAAVAAVLALISATATYAQFSTSGVLSAAAPAWLAAHHVPLRFESGQLGVLPLLATALLMLLVGRTAAGTADRLGLYEPLQARGVVLSIAGAHAVTGGAIALIMGDGVVRATPAVAFFGCAAVSGIAATIGVARRCGLYEVVFDKLDPVALHGLRAGFMALFALVSVGALAVAAGLAVSWPTTSGLFAGAGPSFGVGLGVFLLCLAYLPNAIIAGFSYVVGAGFSMGGVEVTPLRFVGGDVPPVPLLAAMPESAYPWSPGVLVGGLLIGLVVGWTCRKVSDRSTSRVRAVLVAAITAAVGSLVLAATAGGRLAGGAFDPVTVPAGLLALAVLVWVLVPGALVAWLAGNRTKAAAAGVAEFVEPDYDEDEEAVDPDVVFEDDELTDQFEQLEVVDEDEFEVEEDLEDDDYYDEDEYEEEDEYDDEEDVADDVEDVEEEDEEPVEDEEDLDAEFDEMLGMESEEDLDAKPER
ncbi:cell division protein PerM [Lentzea sp. CA-135723]|uniref:cell division protein PerM n=1 Tax=Lentzea sp. CA-135723 TaxID=3239950 RepID=UPI003D8A65E9